jgi:hypothetical protein
MQATVKCRSRRVGPLPVGRNVRERDQENSRRGGKVYEEERRSQR